MQEPFILHPGELDLQEIKNILHKQLTCVLAEESLESIHASHQIVKKVIQEKKIVYGINTGFGSLANQTIPEENLKQLQKI